MEFDELMDTRSLDMIRKVSEEIRDKKFAATSADGLVTVEVVPGGLITNLEINPRVFRNADSKGLAATILQTMNQALTQAAATQLESLQGLTGGGPSSLQGMLDGLSEISERISGRNKG